MKVNKGIRLGIFLLATSMVDISTAPGCQDNSTHLATSSGDYKTWHYVKCSCPCEKRYVKRPDGHCSECEHLRMHSPLMSAESDPTKLINVSGLVAYALTK